MRTSHRRWIAVVWIVGAVLLGARAAWAQVELDRIVSRVNGRIITQSDVRQARALKLVENTTSDEATRRDLENRLLILSEVSRSPAPVASDADLAAGRRRWESSLASGSSLPQLLSQVGMGEADLQNWLRDDARIRGYLARQFAGVPEPDRPAAVTAWLARLRQRAGLD